jgi:nitroreductase
MTDTPFAPRTPEYPISPLFTARWSPRSFDDTPIDAATVLGFIEAARWAPSSANTQPWRFVYALRGDAGWSALLASLSPSNRAWAQRAAALVLIGSTTVVWRAGAEAPVANAGHAFDAGAAWASFAFQAELAGWSTHAMGGFDRAVAAAAVELPPDHQLHAAVAVGKRGDRADLPDELRAREAPNGRRPLSEIAFRDRFPPPPLR